MESKEMCFDDHYTIASVSGKIINLKNPRQEDVDVDDIATALSNACRWRCQLREFYSVAQHSVLVAILVKYQALKIPALFHDGHEGPLGDTPRPLKFTPEFKFLSEWADRWDEVIAKAVGIDKALFKHPLIKAADNALLVLERRRYQPEIAKLLPGEDEHLAKVDVSAIGDMLEPWPPEVARYAFLTAFDFACGKQPARAFPSSKFWDSVRGE